MLPEEIRSGRLPIVTVKQRYLRSYGQILCFTDLSHLLLFGTSNINQRLVMYRYLKFYSLFPQI